MYSQKDIKQIILSFEEKYPVTTWNINNIDVWPYIRIKIYIHMLVLMNKQSLKSNIAKEDIKVKSNKLTSLFMEFSYLFLGQFKLLIFFFRLKQKKLIFFGSHIFRVFQNGCFFNRFYDSMIDYHGIKNEVYMVEYKKIYKPIYNQKAIIPLDEYLFHFKKRSKFFRIFKANKNIVRVRDYSSFYSDLSKLEVDLNILRLDRNNLVKWVNKLKLSEGYFRKLYKKVKPSKVIFLGYYGLDDIYTALVMANKLGIKTIDFQHGPQTNVHLAYANWNKVPINGFNTMPMEFWNWDTKSKESIDSWSSKTKAVSTKVVGQPYLGYWMNKISNLRRFNKEVILYSLQTHPFTMETLITPKIVSLIKISELNWVFRLHPRNNLDLNELDRFLKLNKIESKVIIQDAFNTPLPEVMMKSILHLTNYSGCLIEALQLGIPTLLINEVGMEMFKEYLYDKKVYYLNQNDQDFEQKSKKLIEKLKKINYKEYDLEVFNPSN